MSHLSMEAAVKLRMARVRAEACWSLLDQDEDKADGDVVEHRHTLGDQERGDLDAQTAGPYLVAQDRSAGEARSTPT